MNHSQIQTIKCFALDMDGTFYLGNRLIPGSLEFIRRLEETGRSYVFLTNNSSKSGTAYIEKLAGMGLAVTCQQLVTSGQATIHHLQQKYPGRTVFLLGNRLLAAEFTASGIVCDNENPDLVVTAFDTELDYAKLCKVCDFVRQGKPYIATHPDYNCPTETGFIPDIGAIHAFIHASTGRWPDEIIGKPHRAIIDYALQITGTTPAETAMVGDRLYTDVAAGVNNGLTGILVLSGETKREDIAASEVKPHLIFDSLSQITPFL